MKIPKTKRAEFAKRVCQRLVDLGWTVRDDGDYHVPDDPEKTVLMEVIFEELAK